MTPASFAATAEQYINRNSLAHALGELADICRGKAEHLRENWQDDVSARSWDRAAVYLNTASGRQAVQDVSL